MQKRTAFMQFILNFEAYYPYGTSVYNFIGVYSCRKLLCGYAARISTKRIRRQSRKADRKIILAAILGGALAIYVSMFVMRYRIKNILFMILMPVVAVLNIYFFYLAYSSGLSFIVVR